jgi:hypothetical protein
MSPRPRRVLLLALVALAACNDPRPHVAGGPGPGPGGDPGTPTTPATPGTPTTPADPGTPATPVDPGPFVVGSGTGLSAAEGAVAGAAAIAVSVEKGLYVMDPVLANEPRLAGEVYVAVNGRTPPEGTTVEINGVPLVRVALPGSPESPFRLDPEGPQPEPDADGVVRITVRSGALTKTMALPCPPDVAVTSSVKPDGQLRGKAKLRLSWPEDLDVNPENTFPTDFQTSAKLAFYSYTTHAVGDEHYATKYVPPGQHAVDLEISPSEDGYCAEVRWQGRFFQSGNSRGFCGRAKRIEYHY